MTVETIHLWCFRNHRETQIPFHRQSNILVGKNGQGKTNILEAISYLCLTKSFFGALDSTIVMVGESSFSVEGAFTSEEGHRTTIHAAYTAGTNEKNFTVNNIRLEKRSGHIGKFPIVILSPEHAVITLGGPGERRRFIDLAIAQTSSLYLDDIMEYRKVLRQRNSILADARMMQTNPSATIDAWNESLVQYASRIIYRRKLFLEQFTPRMTAAYTLLSGQKEIPQIEYLPARNAESAEEIRYMLEKELHEKRIDEQKIGTTLVGPHRDEIRFSINGLEMRKYASQGQHKSFLIALKMAEFWSLKEMCGETPIVLLDDIFSELDRERTNRLIEQMATIGQTFITTTEKSFVKQWSAIGRQMAQVNIVNGSATYVDL